MLGLESVVGLGLACGLVLRLRFCQVFTSGYSILQSSVTQRQLNHVGKKV